MRRLPCWARWVTWIRPTACPLDTRFLYEWANDHCRRRSIALEDKRHFPMPDPFETYLGKAREFVAGEIAFEVATTGGGYY
jgi:hypothetical protein